MPRIPRPASNENGFTLVEMTVVILILAVMGAVAIPAFRNWVQEDDLTVATRRLESLFKLARDSAVYSGSSMTVWIDSATSSVWLVGETSDTAAVDTLRQRKVGELTVTPGESLELPESIRIELTHARARFRFAASGAVFADSLSLVSAYTTRLITLHPWTGDVIYQQP
jgi:prepilin-type N-terminal cleavage/methylation domain-containing protein